MDPEIPPKKFMWVLLNFFCVLSKEMRHINFFFCGPKISGMKIQPKEEVFGRTSLRTSRQKTSVRNSKSWKIKHFGTDIPRGRPCKNFGLKNFGLILRSLKTGVLGGGAKRAHTKGVVQQRALLRRILGRVPGTAFEKVLRMVLRRGLAVGFNGKKGS